MPRLYEIHAAFVAAIQQNSKGYQRLRTENFIRELDTYAGISARWTL